MSRAPYRLDRVATAVVAVLLIALGLVLLDWRYEFVLHQYPRRISLGSLPVWATSSWWPWALAAVTLVIGLIGLWWLLAHLRLTTVKTTKLSQSDDHGTLTVDAASLANAVAHSMQEAGPFSSATASTTHVGQTTTVVITAHIDEHADGAGIREAVQTVQEQLRSSFHDEGITARVLLTKPRPPRSGRKSRASIRVH